MDKVQKHNSFSNIKLCRGQYVARELHVGWAQYESLYLE
jgi:hypothetical protein